MSLAIPPDINGGMQAPLAVPAVDLGAPPEAASADFLGRADYGVGVPLVDMVLADPRLAR